jgi:hypothetical protein
MAASSSARLASGIRNAREVAGRSWRFRCSGSRFRPGSPPPATYAATITPITSIACQGLGRAIETIFPGRRHSAICHIAGMEVH